MACAAASFISSLIVRRAHVERAAEDAREGEHVVDLVRVVGAAGGDDGDVVARPPPGRISGTGLAIANTIASGAIERTAAGDTAPGPDRPMKTSAPASTSSAVPASAARVRALGEPARVGVEARPRPRRARRRRSQPMMSRDAGASRISAHATPAAPAPTTTTRTSSARLPTSFSAFTSAASTTIAVPCWSSWNTGMSSSARSRPSISKQRGAAMSSRLMPPNPARSP